MKEKLKNAYQSMLSVFTRGRRRALSAFLAICLLFESFPFILSLADTSVTIESDMGNGVGILNIDGVNISYNQHLASDGDGHYTLSLNMSATTTLKDNSVESDVAKYGYFVAAQDGTYLFELWGGNGGDGSSTTFGNGGTGGRGGYLYASMTLYAGDVIYYTIGGNGDCTGDKTGGGANGGAAHGDNGDHQVGAGGGYSAVYYFSKASGDADSFMANYCDGSGKAVLSDATSEDRATKYIMIAGGGGGGGSGNSFSLSGQKRTADGGAGGGMNSVSGQLTGDGYDVEGTFYCGANGISSGDDDSYIGHGGSNLPGEAPSSVLEWSSASMANDWLGNATSENLPGAGGSSNLRGGAGGAGFCGGSGGVMTGVLLATNVGGGGGGSSFISSQMSAVSPTLATYLSNVNESTFGGSIKVTYMVDKVEYMKNLVLSSVVSKYFTVTNATYSTGTSTVVGNTVSVSGIELGVPSLGTPGVSDFDVTIGLQIIDGFGGGNDVPLFDSFTISAPDADDTSPHDIGLEDACSYVNVPWNFTVKTHNFVATSSPYTLDLASRLFTDTVSSIDLNATEYDFIDAISGYSIVDENDIPYPLDGPIANVTADTRFTVSYTVTPTPSAGKAVVGDVLTERTFSRTAKIMLSAGGEGALGETVVTYQKTVEYNEATGKYTLMLNQKYEADISDPVSPTPVSFQYGDANTQYNVTLDGYYYIQVWGGNGGQGGTSGLGGSGGSGGTGGYVGTWVHLSNGDTLSVTLGANGSQGTKGSGAGSGGRQGSGGGATTVKLNGTVIVGAGGGGGGGGGWALLTGSDGRSVDNAKFGTSATDGSPDSNNSNQKMEGGSAGSNAKNGSYCEVVYDSITLTASLSAFGEGNYTEQGSVGGACFITCIQPDLQDGYDVICGFGLNAQISEYFDIESVSVTGATVDGTNTHVGGQVILSDINPTNLTSTAKNATTDTWKGETNVSIVCTPKSGFMGGNDVPLLDPTDTVFTNAMTITQGLGTLSVDRSDLSDYVNVPLSGNTAVESDITVTDRIYVIGSGVPVPVSSLVSFSGTLPTASWASAFVTIVSPEDSADFGGNTALTPTESTVYTVEAGIKPIADAAKAVVPASVSDLTVTRTVRVDVELLVDFPTGSHLNVSDEKKVRNEFNGSPEEIVTVLPNEEYTTTLVPDDGWELPNTLRIFIDGVEIFDFTYNPLSGELTIPAADMTGSIEIAASAKEKTYTLHYVAAKDLIGILSTDYTVQVKAGVKGSEFNDILNALIANYDPASVTPVPGYTYGIEYSTPDGSALTEMPANDTWIYGVYAPNKYKLTVNYVDGVGAVLYTAHVEDVYYGMPYSVTSPSVDHYAPDSFTVDAGTGMTGNAVTVSGNMGAGDVTVTVTYRSTLGKLNIIYLYKDGSEAAPTYVGDVTEGEGYSVTSPTTVVGHTADTAVVSGTMPDNNGLTVYVYYVPNKYTLSFNVDGGELIADRPIYYGMTYADTGESYDTVTYTALPTPIKLGYKFLGWYDGSDQVKNATTFTKTENTTIKAKWETVEYTVTIHLLFKDGGSAGADIVRKGSIGDGYEYTPDPITGYVTPVKQVGTFIASNQSKDYTYVGNIYNLTVKYLNVSNGNKSLIPDKVVPVEFGTDYCESLDMTIISTYITSGLMTVTPTTYNILGTMDVVGGKTETFYFTKVNTDTFEVTVTFGTFAYDYTNATWDPENLTYKIPKMDGVDNSVTVKNEASSDVEVNVTISYEQVYALSGVDCLNAYFTETDSVSATRTAAPSFDLQPDTSSQRWMWMEGILETYIGSADQDSTRVMGRCVVTIGEAD